MAMCMASMMMNNSGYSSTRYDEDRLKAEVNQLRSELSELRSEMTKFKEFMKTTGSFMDFKTFKFIDDSDELEKKTMEESRERQRMMLCSIRR